MFMIVSEQLALDFRADGSVDVQSTLSRGITWFFKPGPAHLDTCEFSITSTLDRDLVLKYVGFIDRGQRIESRSVRYELVCCVLCG